MLNALLFIIAFLLFIFVVGSPIILFIGLLNMKYILDDEFLLIKFLGFKARKIKYSDIKGIAMFEHIPFLKGKLSNLPFNRAIMVELDSSKFLVGKTVIAPRNREEFAQELTQKLNKKTEAVEV